MALSGIQIYKLLPQTNCKECGFPTCLAFAMKLAAKQVELSACPYVTEASKTQLAESAAPPVRLVTLKSKTSEFASGNEVVLFRHEKTFYRRPGLFILVRDNEPLESIKAKVARAEAYSVVYVGMDLTIDGFAVEAVSGSPAAFTAAVKATRSASTRPLILVSSDPAVVSAGLAELNGERPLICGANETNWEAMAAVAKQSQSALAVRAGTVDALAALTEKIKATGLEDLVLDPESKGLSASLANNTLIRRLAIKKNFRALGYPIISFAGVGTASPLEEAIVATQAIAKYAGFIVLDTFQPELVYSLLVLRQNIYTDPQKPIQVTPGLYEINSPKPDSPLLVTTNFSITYFSVANEVEGSGIPARLLVVDAEGMSVLTAWAAGKFDADRIAKAVKTFDVDGKVSLKRIILPGHVAVLSGEVEEALPGWEIRVGPREAVDIPSFLRKLSNGRSYLVAEHTVTFETHGTAVSVPTGTLLVDAARLAGIPLSQPCGGQGRCGRCAVQVTSGSVRSRSTLRLSSEDIQQGYTLACQSVVEGSITVAVPPQDKIERRLTTDRTVAEVTVPAGYATGTSQTMRRLFLSLTPPSMDDQTDDWSRLQTALRNQAGISSLQASLPTLRKLGTVLREGEWQVTVVTDIPEAAPEPLEGRSSAGRLVAVYPGDHTHDPLWGAAVDIGTTTVTLWLVDLVDGQVRAQASEYNQQIQRGEDVVSRIIYASKNGGAEEMRSLVLATINQLLQTACKRVKISPAEVLKTTIAGNSTMIHLLLGLPAQSIRLGPFVTAVNQPPLLTAAEVGLEIHPEATVDCLPGIASYVGSDITAGVYASGMDETEKLTLFMDVGTNGEIVLGSHEWLISCACSAGPAFEGAGVRDGMRATQGAIEEIWIEGREAPAPYEPSFRVIGNGKPVGLCGSGLLALLAELFLTGIIDKGGNFHDALPTPRVRHGDHGWEYVVAWAGETAQGRDIVFSRTDIDNLLRAKAAIYAGFSVLAASVGLSLEMAEQVLIGGSFGRYINVEKAIQIGLLPDMPWDRFLFLGNTAVKGAYYALLDRTARQKITDIASRMTYLELSADNSFYESFMSALFLPHTDLFRFPSVALAIENER